MPPIISLLYFDYICNKAALLRVQFCGYLIWPWSAKFSVNFWHHAHGYLGGWKSNISTRNSSAGRQQCLEPLLTYANDHWIQITAAPLHYVTNRWVFMAWTSQNGKVSHNLETYNDTTFPIMQLGRIFGKLLQTYTFTTVAHRMTKCNKYVSCVKLVEGPFTHWCCSVMTAGCVCVQELCLGARQDFLQQSMSRRKTKLAWSHAGMLVFAVEDDSTKGGLQILWLNRVTDV